MKLYELTETYNQIKELDLEEEELQKLLDIADGSIEEKIENIIKVIKEFETFNLGIKAEKDRLSQFEKVNKNKIDSLKRYIDTSMKIISKDKLSAGLFKVSYRKSSSLVVTDESKIPEEFFKIIPETRQVDKMSLKTYMKTNECEGATIEEKQNLQIK